MGEIGKTCTLEMAIDAVGQSKQVLHCQHVIPQDAGTFTHIYIYTYTHSVLSKALPQLGINLCPRTC